MLRAHQEQGADVTIACIEVPLTEARAFGVMIVDENMQIVHYEEKPEKPTPNPLNPDNALVSMGLYVFSSELLKQALIEDQDKIDSDHDFGKDILPLLVSNNKLKAYKFGGELGRVKPDGYWRDVGTIDAYYQANMDLLKPVPPLNLYQSDWPIRTYQPQQPPARTIQSDSGTENVLANSILAGGVVISGGNVSQSILSSDIFVDDKAMIDHSILLGGLHVGAAARLKNCIVDKDVHIPPGEEIGYDLDKDRKRFTVSDKGIVTVPEGYRFD